MNPKKSDRVGNKDIADTAHKAARLQSNGYQQTDLRNVTSNTANVHPTVSHEPVMPVEVFLHGAETDDLASE